MVIEIAKRRSIVNAIDNESVATGETICSDCRTADRTLIHTDSNEIYEMATKQAKSKVEHGKT